MFSFRARHAYESGFQLDAEFTADGAVTALFGPSGSGKTSIIEMIAGLRRPQAGRITLGDRVLFDSTAKVDCPMQQRGVGLVAQDQLLFPHLAVRANLKYGMRRQQRNPVEFERVVEVLELGDLLGRWPQHLSGGERQRVALGRALVSGPELLLLDEPLAALDEPLKARILDYLERVLAEWRIPTLLVSHNEAEVRRLAEQVITLDNGRVVAAGPVDSALG